MNTLHDYLAWRGDLSFRQAPFGEIDAFLLSQLSYINWDMVLSPRDTGLLSDVASQLVNYQFATCFTAPNDKKLLPVLSATRRFGQVRMTRVESVLDREAGEQFFAVSFLLDDGTVFASFRGTDGTLVGWREDFCLSLSDAVPAQEHAREYLQSLLPLSPLGLRAGGHSKGGNLALYAASACSGDLQAKILGIYPFDAPGQNDRTIVSPGYAAIEDRIHAYVPASSIIGLLMNPPLHYTIVRSTHISIMQHDPYTWVLDGPRFETVPTLNRDAVYVDTVLHKWLLSVDQDERASLIKTLFDVLESTNASRFGDEFWSNLLKNPAAFLSAIFSTDREQVSQAAKVLKSLVSAIMSTPFPDSPPPSGKPALA